MTELQAQKEIIEALVEMNEDLRTIRCAKEDWEKTIELFFKHFLLLRGEARENTVLFKSKARGDENGNVTWLMAHRMFHLNNDSTKWIITQFKRRNLMV